jgi:hypothetical protein
MKSRLTPSPMSRAPKTPEIARNCPVRKASHRESNLGLSMISAKSRLDPNPFESLCPLQTVMQARRRVLADQQPDYKNYRSPICTSVNSRFVKDNNLFTEQISDNRSIHDTEKSLLEVSALVHHNQETQAKRPRLLSQNLTKKADNRNELKTSVVITRDREATKMQLNKSQSIISIPSHKQVQKKNDAQQKAFAAKSTRTMRLPAQLNNPVRNSQRLEASCAFQKQKQTSCVPQNKKGNKGVQPANNAKDQNKENIQNQKKLATTNINPLRGLLLKSDEHFVAVQNYCYEHLASILQYIFRHDTNRLGNYGLDFLLQSPVKSAHIPDGVRTELYDWLTGLALNLELSDRSFFLAIEFFEEYVDRSASELEENLQLMALTALFVAGKFEEVRTPSIREFCSPDSRSQTIPRIIEAEHKLMSVLLFRLNRELHYDFFLLFLETGAFEPKAISYGLMLLHLAVVNGLMRQLAPSSVAFSVCYLLSKFFKSDFPYLKVSINGNTYYKIDLFSGKLEPARKSTNSLLKVRSFEAVYRETEVKRIVQQLLEAAMKLSKQRHENVFRKFSLVKFHSVAKYSVIQAKGSIVG